MIFINPKTDFAFKKIFGSEESKDILISFLNAILYDSSSIITDLTVLNPYLAPKIRGVKDTYLDVKAKLADGTTVIIEMQVLNVEGFEKRILYNAAKAYSLQLQPKASYSTLNPVIALTITDFEMFEFADKVISRFILKEKDFLIDYPIYDIELVFVELPKFLTSLDQLETIADKWLYFMKEARGLDSIPTSMAEIDQIQKAFVIANQSNLSLEELDELDHQEMFIHDSRNAVLRGVREGRELGKAEGKAEGEKETKLEIARKMLARFDDATISQITALSIAEIHTLREQSSNDERA